MSVRHSGVGSWPGTDMAATIRMTLGELPGSAYLPELPARGPGSDMIGRACALVEELDFDLTPTGWRISEGTSLVRRRAAATWRDDLDILEEQAQGFDGSLRVCLVGPFTLAAAVELPRGGKVLADAGATRDLRQGLTQAAIDLVTELSRRLGVLVHVQLDEPSLGAVRHGLVPSASGLHRYPRLPGAELGGQLGEVVEALRPHLDPAARILVHSCASRVPLADLRGSGIDGVGIDLDHLESGDLDQVAALLDGGGMMHLGVAPTGVPDVLPGPDRLAARALGLLRPLEMGPSIAERLTLTPACGLAGWSGGAALELLRQLGSAADIVTEELAR